MQMSTIITETHRNSNDEDNPGAEAAAVTGWGCVEMLSWAGNTNAGNAWSSSLQQPSRRSSSRFLLLPRRRRVWMCVFHLQIHNYSASLPPPFDGFPLNDWLTDCVSIIISLGWYFNRDHVCFQIFSSSAQQWKRGMKFGWLAGGADVWLKS